MLGLIVPLIFTYKIYKNAKENGRNGVLWAIINLIVTFGVQILFGATVLVIGLTAFEWTDQTIDEYSLPLNLIGIVLSLTASYFIFWFVTRVPDESFRELPPDPPKFD